MHDIVHVRAMRVCRGMHVCVCTCTCIQMCEGVRVGGGERTIIIERLPNMGVEKVDSQTHN